MLVLLCGVGTRLAQYLGHRVKLTCDKLLFQGYRIHCADSFVNLEGDISTPCL
jgi:hypothetical protein